MNSESKDKQECASVKTVSMSMELFVLQFHITVNTGIETDTTP